MQVLLFVTLFAVLATVKCDAANTTQSNNTAMNPPSTNASYTSKGTTGNATMPGMPTKLPTQNATMTGDNTKMPGGNSTAPAGNATLPVGTTTTENPTTPTSTSAPTTTETEMTHNMTTTMEPTTPPTPHNSSAVVLTSFSAISLCALSLMVAS